MEEDRMRRVFIEENCETLAKVSADIVFLQYVTVDSALRHFSFPVFEIRYSTFCSFEFLCFNFC